jgi:hypothetical protein
MPGTLRKASRSRGEPCCSITSCGTTLTDCGVFWIVSGSFVRLDVSRR